MIDDVAVRKYAYRVAGPIDLVINVVLNTIIPWAFLRGIPQVPLFGLPSAFAFWGPMVVCVCFFATFFGYMNGARLRHATAAKQPTGSNQSWMRHGAAAGLCYAIVTLGLLTGVLGVLHSQFQITSLSSLSVILIDGGFAGGLGYWAQVNGVLRAQQPRRRTA